MTNTIVPCSGIAVASGDPRTKDEEEEDEVVASTSSASTASGGSLSLWERRRGSRPQLAPPSLPGRSAAAEAIGETKARLDAEYVLGELLGSGSIGKVYRAARRRDGQAVALKVVHATCPEMCLLVLREFEMLQQLSHPNIVRALDFHAFGVIRVLSLEHFDGQTLKRTVAERGPATQAVAQPLARALFGALAHLHGQGFLHRDPHPDNVLISPGMDDLRLIDFSAAACHHTLATAGGDEALLTCIAPTTPLTPVGVNEYVAPEVVLGQAAATSSSDVWTAGLCLHLLLTGQLPQQRGSGAAEHGLSIGRLLQVSRRPFDPEAEHLRHLSGGCREALQLCLATRPADRTSAAELLGSAWLAGPAPGAP